jgi:hypothetical protein
MYHDIQVPTFLLRKQLALSLRIVFEVTDVKQQRRASYSDPCQLDDDDNDDDGGGVGGGGDADGSGNGNDLTHG